MKKLFAELMTLACMTLVVWFVASVVDVNYSNARGRNASPWNMFVTYVEAA